jgi:hypothetical protein
MERYISDLPYEDKMYLNLNLHLLTGDEHVRTGNTGTHIDIAYSTTSLWSEKTSRIGAITGIISEGIQKSHERNRRRTERLR